MKTSYVREAKGKESRLLTLLTGINMLCATWSSWVRVDRRDGVEERAGASPIGLRAVSRPGIRPCSMLVSVCVASITAEATLANRSCRRSVNIAERH